MPDHRVLAHEGVSIMTHRSAVNRFWIRAVILGSCLWPAVEAVAQQAPTSPPPKRSPVGQKPLQESGRAESGNWGQFLGPARNGISSERDLLEVWPAGGVKEVW